MRIKLHILLAVMSFMTLEVAAQSFMKSVEIDSVVVTTSIKLQEIGVQKTHIASKLLKENVTLSLADVLTQNSVIFIKSFGRASLSTASFRGTAPSHTQVTWNGMKINSPMLGMVDFSLIPSYFVDNVDLYHGASSTNVAAGGLGGAVSLSTASVRSDGLNMKYVQGIGSFATYDQYLNVTYGTQRWQTATRVLYSTSKNDFEYTNYNKFKVPVYDAAGNVTDYKYPRETNANSDFKDFHLLQEFYYDSKKSGRFSLSAWLTDSRRGVPTLNVSYRDENMSRARQNERTFRSVAGWNNIYKKLSLNAAAGYNYTDLNYVYSVDAGDAGNLTAAINAQSYVNTLFAKFDAEYVISQRLMLKGGVEANQYFVDSSDKSLASGITGYSKGRPEVSANAALKWKLNNGFGVAASLREDMYGGERTPLIPALFAEYVPFRSELVTVKSSLSRNYRYPTLNDMYYMPGGNPDLKPESGYTYDLGAELSYKNRFMRFTGEFTWFDSYIDDWIMWRPTFKGFYTPLNINRVHNYGVEVKWHADTYIGNGWRLFMSGLFTATHSVNKGKPVSDADNSTGKQLPYVPVYSASVSANMQYNGWQFAYKWCYYSERFTTSTNTYSIAGTISPYYMSDISVSKKISAKPAIISVRFDVKNLFNEEYESVLSHPMPGRNFGLTLEITPVLNKKGGSSLKR